MNLFFSFIFIFRCKSDIYLFETGTESDPIISIDERIDNSFEIAKQLFLNNFSVGLSLSDTKYIITSTTDVSTDYKPIDFSNSPFNFLDLNQKVTASFNFGKLFLYFIVVFSFCSLFTFIALKFPIHKINDLFTDKAMFVPKGADVNLEEKFGELEGEQLRFLLQMPEMMGFFNLRPVKIVRDEHYQTVYFSACLPFDGFDFLFNCQMDNVEDDQIHFKCEVTTKDGKVRPSTIKFTSFRDFRPIRVDYFIDNNVEVSTYLPSAVFGPFIPGGNLLSISSSMFFNANAYLERDSLSNFNFPEILKNYCTKLGIVRALFYSKESGLFHSFTKPGHRTVSLEEMKKLIKNKNFQDKTYANVFEQGDCCYFDVAKLRALTVYTIYDIGNLPQDHTYKFFFVHFIRDFCIFLFQVSHTKEQNLRFTRFVNLIASSSIFSLFELSITTNTLTLIKSSLFPPEASTFEDAYNILMQCGDPSIKRKIDSVLERTRTVDKLQQIPIEINGKDHKWFQISTYTTYDPVTEEHICSILAEDITPLKQQEIDLDDSIADLKFASQALGLNRFSINGGELIDQSESLGRILGRKEKPIHIEQIIHPTDKRSIYMLGKKMITVRLQKGDGNYMWFSLFGSEDVGFCFNVDEAVKTRERLQMTGKGLQLASVTSSLIFWCFDIETGIVSSLLQQPTIWEVLSVDPKAKFSKFMDFIADEERSTVSKAIKDIKEGIIHEWTGECRIMKYGNYEWHRVIFALAKHNSVHCFAASINRQKETAKKLADNCKIRDIIFSSGKLTVWKYFDDDLPVTGQKRLVPGIPTVVRVNRTFINECMQPEVAVVFQEKVNQAIKTGESIEFKVSEDDKFYSIRGRLQQSTQQVVGICVDVTDVEKANKELEEQRAIAVEANRQKTVFLANMSHEIRTPMNPIFGLLDLIAQSEITDEQRLLVDTMRSLSFQLLKLLDDTLNLSKIEQGDIVMNPTCFDLWAAIEPVIVASASRARKNNIKFLVKSLPRTPLGVYSDPHLLQQVLNNLFSNALKFTKKGSIELSVSWEETDQTTDGEPNEILKITVSDTGIGISHDQQKVIFERFVQADPSVPRSYGGTGLGLSLVQEIVRFLGGALSLESDLGKGSTFHISIPIQSTKFATVAPFKDGKNHYILIMSKDEMTKETVKKWAEELHFHTKIVPNVNEAVNMTQTEIVDGIVIDRPAEVVNKLINNVKVPICALIEAEESSKAEYRLTRPILPHQLCGFFNSCRYGMKTKVQVIPQKQEKNTKRVLVVEDNKQNQFVMQKILQKIGCTFLMADNGQVAIDILDQNINEPFDLIFMDCQMPVLDGLSATRLIRASDKPYKNVHIIALTANAVEGDKETCLEAGMDAYLSKPVRVQQIKDALTMFD